jgi:hypothetical protein
MVKTKFMLDRKKKNGKKQVQHAPPVQRQLTTQSRGPVTKAPFNSLDSYAKAHAMMIADPCRAPLGYSTYPGGSGGQIARFSQDLILFNEFGTDTGGCLIWSPGYASYVQSNNLSALVSDTQNFGLTDLRPAAGNAAVTNTSGYRCLAACMQIYYPGTELNRSGFVGMGYTTGGTIIEYQRVAVGGDGNLTLNVGGLRQTQFHSERTPNTMLELKWKPSQADEQFTSGISQANQVATNALGLASRNCLTLTASGLSPGVGLRVRFVAIYEYLQQPSIGIIGTAGNAPRSKNTTNEVLRALDSMGNWFITTATKYGPEILGAIGYASTFIT